MGNPFDVNPKILRVAKILEIESRAIATVPVGREWLEIFDLLLNCNGKIVTTGMGKAGNIAEKMAGTLCSTGTPAVYLHPGEALHGDLGILDAGDVIICFSNSGQTLEVLKMLELSKKLGVNKIITITSHPESEIKRYSNVVLDMGTFNEACSLGLTPSTSTTVMLAISDAIALVLMESKGFTKEDFGCRHHAGYLGKVSNATHS